MPLNVISNFAANVAHRNLVQSDMQATSSLAKLSAGTRVLTAKDDAASLAIGSRLAAEVSALRQATVNANQGISLLQIADGAMARISDILIRAKTLAVQAGSGQLSDIERGMLDTELQALLSEISRISLDTEFNGIQLLAGSQTLENDLTNAEVADGVVSVTLSGFTSGDILSSFEYSTGNKTFSVDVEGVTYTGTIDADALSGNDMAQGTVVTLTATGEDAEIKLVLNVSFDATADTTDVATSVQINGSSTTSYDFKVGTGVIATQDSIVISLTSITVGQLGLTSQDVTSQSQADLASVAISNAIDTLQTARAEVGAAQNRLEFAAANIATTVENTEAARSGLMDLDVAAEMTTFTSKQILVQAGVSMLAQANQLPQNLLRLFQ